MSFLHMDLGDFAVKAVEYRPSHTYTGVSGYEYPIPAVAQITFDNADIRLNLHMDDAEKLMYALAVAMVEHAVAQKVSASKAVA